MPPTVLIKDLSSEQSAGSTVLEDHDMDCYILGCFVIQQTENVNVVTFHISLHTVMLKSAGQLKMHPFFIAMS